MLNFLLSAALSFGSSSLLNLFGGGDKRPWTTIDNKIQKFDEPNSRYGEPIHKVFGKVKVEGIYFACQIPPSWETDENPNPVTKEILRTEIYYGRLGVLWASQIPLENNPEIKKIWFNKLLYYQNGQIDGVLGEYWQEGWEGLSVNHHFGDQLTNDDFLDFQGFFNTPYHGMCFTSMFRLRLNNGPNSTTNLFNSSYPGLEAEIHTHTTATLYLDEVVKELCLDGEYSEEQLDVTELSTIETRGYKATIGTTADKLKPLQLAYNFEVIDTGSQLKFIKQYRSSASAYIPLEALILQDDGRGGKTLFTEKDSVELKDLPTVIRVIFSDYNKDYQQNSKDSYSLNSTSGTPNIKIVDLGNITLTETEAYNIANRLLQLEYLRSKTYKISVLGRYCGLEAGDVIEVPFRDDEITQIQIRDFNQNDETIEIIALPYDPSIYDFSYTSPATNATTATATQGTPISTGQTNITSIISVTSNDGSTTYVLGTDYTVNLSNGTITPIVGGSIPTGSNPIIIWEGDEIPALPPSVPDIPPNPNAGNQEINYLKLQYWL